jgi:SAM-dependent methyltransferase
MDSERNPVRAFLREHLVGGERLLDVGCGIGQNCRWLAQIYREVIGVDVSGRMVEIARSRPHPPNVRFLHQDAWELHPGVDGRFDGLLVLNTAFHMGAATSRVLDHFRRLLTPGGTLVVVDVVRPDDAPSPQPARTESGTSDEQRRTIFDTARAVHEMSGDIEAAIDSIRLMTHPRWLEMSATLVPMNRSEFQATYADRLPGVVFENEVVSELAMAVWRAPGSPSAQHRENGVNHERQD